MAPVSVKVPFPLLVIPLAPDIFPLSRRLVVPTVPPLATERVNVPPRIMLLPMVYASAVVFAVLLALMVEVTVKFPAPASMLIFAVELVKVRLPAVTSLFTVVFPAAVKLPLSPFVQVTPVVPLYQGVPPVQLPSPPGVEVPAELHVRFAAEAREEAAKTASKMSVKKMATRLQGEDS